MKYFLLLCCLSALLTGCKEQPAYQANSASKVKEHILKNLSLLSQELKQFEKMVQSENDPKALQGQFLKCRLLFKDTEWATEYFLPKSSKSLNGPPLDQLDLDENKFIDAEGFQVLEEYLYPEVVLTEKASMIRQIRIIDNLIRAGRTNIEVFMLTDDQVFDALRLGMFKITTLGITGFDTPASNLLFPETQAALKGIGTVLELYGNNLQQFESYSRVAGLIREAQLKVSGKKDKNTFNYLKYFTVYLDPISKGLHKLQTDAGIPFVNRISMLKPEAASLFAEGTFNLDAVVPDKQYLSSAEKVNLGKKLFYDTQLSKNNDRSCASCHQPEKAFTDGLKVAEDLVGSPLLRNTPSLNYAGFYHGQFWDMRQTDIESLTTSVIENKDEMHGDMQTVIKMVRSNPQYATEFKKIYKTQNAEGWQVQNALATYVRSLSTFSSRFDAYMRGDKTSLNAEEKEGFNVFVGKGKCATCHFIPLFNGTVPPRFSSSEQEVLGIPKDAAVTALDGDLGRQLYNMDLHQLKNSFKTMTVRNIAQTAPYMHNGVFNTLEEVVAFYNKGGGAGFNLHVGNQTLPADALELTPKEERALIAFMKALTDE